MSVLDGASFLIFVMAANLPVLGVAVLLIAFLFPSAFLARVIGLTGNLFPSNFPPRDVDLADDLFPSAFLM